MKPIAQRPYVIKHKEDYFDEFFLKDEVTKTDKQPFIGDTSKDVKNGRELLKGRRLKKIRLLDEKLSPSQNICNYQQDKIVVGDNTGRIYIFNFVTKEKKSWNKLNSKVMQIKITEHKLLVTAEKGFAIFNIEGFMESAEEYPALIFKEFGKKTYGLDVTQTDQEDDLAFFGNLEGDVKAINLTDLSLSSQRSIHEGKEPRSSFIGAIDRQTYYSSNHKKELNLFWEDNTYNLLNKDKKTRTQGLIILKDMCIVALFNERQKTSSFEVFQGRENIKIQEVEFLGKIQGISASSTQDFFALAGDNGVAIYDNTFELNFFIRTEFEAKKLIFSENDQWLIILDKDGYIRVIDWKQTDTDLHIEETEIYDSQSSRDGRSFAVATHTSVHIYNTDKIAKVGSFSNLKEEFTYQKMKFTNDSNHLILAFTKENDVEIQIISIDHENQVASGEINLNIEEIQEIRQIEVSTELKEIYICFGPFWNYQMNIYDFDGLLKENMINIRSMALSPDGTIQVLSNELNKIEIRHAKLGKVIDEIQYDDLAIDLEFFQDSKQFIAVGEESLKAFDILTHKVLFTIDKVPAPWSKIQFLINEDMIAFESEDNKIVFYDTVNQSEMAVTMPLKKDAVDKKFQKGELVTHNTAWCVANKLFLMQLEDKILVRNLPYLSFEQSNQDFINNGFESMNGTFIPVIGGGPNYSTASFGLMYNSAFERKDDSTLLQTIYPFKLNALHWFALSGNNLAIEYCFLIGVKFSYDIFSKNPLHYAIKSQDLTSINSIFKGLLVIDPEQASLIMQMIPLNQLLTQDTPDLAELIKRIGAYTPLTQQFNTEQAIPKNYEISKDQTIYCQSTTPIYSITVANNLHGKDIDDDSEDTYLVSTKIINNPVPQDFSKASVDLLGKIRDFENDEVVIQDSITIVLQRKWDSYAQKFFLIQLALYLGLLGVLIAFFELENDAAVYLLGTIAIVLTSIFLSYEVLQMIIQKKEYFKDFWNWLDIIRIFLIYFCIFTERSDFKLGEQTLAIMFSFVWIKVIKYLQVFKPLRYLIKMIFECIWNLRTFMSILLIAMLAYAQINQSISKDSNFIHLLRSSYVLSFGELGDFAEAEVVKFFVFALFSFIIPLVLMNLLIAIMSDAYAKIQENSKAADARSLAEMEMEMEQLVYFFKQFFQRHHYRDEFYYLFYTKAIDYSGGDEEDQVDQIVEKVKDLVEYRIDRLEQLINDKFPKPEEKEANPEVNNTINQTHNSNYYESLNQVQL